MFLQPNSPEERAKQRVSQHHRDDPRMVADAMPLYSYIKELADRINSIEGRLGENAGKSIRNNH